MNYKHVEEEALLRFICFLIDRINILCADRKIERLSYQQGCKTMFYN